MRKYNKIEDHSGNQEAIIKANGFLILNDNWLLHTVKEVFCVETNKRYEVLEFQEIELTLLKPENQRLPAIAFSNPFLGLSNWHIPKLSCLKVKDQHELKPGYILYETYNENN